MVIGNATTLWGNGVDEVKVAIKNLPLGTIQIMGQKKNCLKISYKGVDYVRFGDTDMIDALMENRLRKIDIIGSFSVNEWNGRRSLQVFIDEWQFSNEEEEKAHKFDF